MPPTTQSAAAGATNALTSSMDNSLGADSGAVMAPISPNVPSPGTRTRRNRKQKKRKNKKNDAESVADVPNPTVASGHNAGLWPSIDKPQSVYDWIDHRINKSKQPILVVGGQNLSLTLALAMMRGTVQDIWSAHPTQPQAQKHHPKLMSQTRSRITAAAQAAKSDDDVKKDPQGKKGFRSPPRRVLEEWKRLKSLLVEGVSSYLFDPEQLFISDFDARYLEDYLPLYPGMPKGNIWFDFTSIEHENGIAKHIRHVLRSTAKVQALGDTVYLSLVIGPKIEGSDSPTFAAVYELPELLKTARSAGYDVFWEEEMSKKCLERGYQPFSKAMLKRVSGFLMTYVLVKTAYTTEFKPKPQVDRGEEIFAAYSDEESEFEEEV